MTDTEDLTQVRVHIENGPWTASLEAAEQVITAYLKKFVEGYSASDHYRWHVEPQEYTITDEILLHVGWLPSQEHQWKIDLNKEEFYHGSCHT